MMGLEFVFLCHTVEHWKFVQQPTHSPDNYVAAMDGKRNRKGLSDEVGRQRFVGLISLFAIEASIIWKFEAFIQQDSSESNVVQILLETLQLQGKLITVDILHMQKNAAVNCWVGQWVSGCCQSSYRQIINCLLLFIINSKDIEYAQTRLLEIAVDQYGQISRFFA